jgi:hypothetical protein
MIYFDTSPWLMNHHLIWGSVRGRVPAPQSETMAKLNKNGQLLTIRR